MKWPGDLLGFALRRALIQGYGRAELLRDLSAGAVVGVVALPLSMALAIATGVPPWHGLYTAVVAGVVIALLGGSRTQVSGPTAAFVAVLAPIVAEHGVGGLLVATVLAGLILMLLGLARLGRFVEFVPHPVTIGFTAGIAVVIASLQVEDFLGLVPAGPAEGFGGRVVLLARALPTLDPAEAAVGLFTLALLVAGPRITRRVPAPLLALTAAAVGVAVAQHLWPALSIDTLATRFTYETPAGPAAGVPRLPPLPVLPWALPGGDGAPLGLSFELVRDLLPSALAIAFLGAIESLLSAVVADGMTGFRHDPDSELLAQGIGNVVAPFFGGIAATGALARTATNVRAGGRSPVAAITHALVVLASILALAPLLGTLPMASLAALLLVVAWNMSEARHVARVVKTAPRSDVVTLLVCLGLTVVFDMVVAVTVGIALAGVLFLRRMAEVTGVELVGARRRPPRLGADVLVYQIAGPLFFGAAHKAMSALETVDPSARVVLLDLASVPALDATGLVNLDSAVSRLRRDGVLVVLGGLQPQPLRALVRAGWRGREGVRLFRSLERAVEAIANPAERAASH